MPDKRLSKQEQAILDLLIESAPTPLTEGEMRLRLGVTTEEQAQFGRRRRELHRYYHIEKVRVGTKVAYVYKGPLDEPRAARRMNNRLRVEILTRDGSRCQICGRSPKTDPGVVLQVDHKIPGGPDTADNLWTLCRECNHGKKDLFKSYDIDSKALVEVMASSSVHVRIGELLKLVGSSVPSFLIELVANQDDWQRRLRELRYLGWEFKSSRRGKFAGRVQVTYELLRSEPWPTDPSGAVREIERARAKAKRRK
jgi:hypothetical protein